MAVSRWRCCAMGEGGDVNSARKRAKPRPRGVYCTVTTKKRCPRKRYEGQTKCAIHYADELARAYVLARDDDTCRRCGATGCDWAHIFSRRYKLIRWNPDNSMALCRGCHMWQTQNPIEGDIFFSEQIGAAHMAELRVMATANEKPDPHFWIAYFELYAEELP